MLGHGDEAELYLEAAAFGVERGGSCTSQSKKDELFGQDEA